MHDPRVLLTEDAVTALGRRGFQLDTGALAALSERRTRLVHERDDLRGALRRKGRTGAGPTDREQARKDRALLQEREADLRACEAELHALLLTVPNLPSPTAPDGRAQDEPVVLRTWRPDDAGDDRPQGRSGERPLDHVTIGESLRILDTARAARLSGARFAVTRGPGARLERALVSFLLDFHAEQGYVEHGVPHLVTSETMTGTGQLPKFGEDLFHTRVADRELLLIPTAEVPLVNLYRGENLDPHTLPLALTACTPCYRAEAGSYGRDNRGLIRLHQFEKVELVRICHPDSAEAELDQLVDHVESCLKRLGLRHRVVDLRAGDLGFSACRTFDVEVWLPGQQAYREISSCSNCGDFQARRAGIRLRGERRHPVTLNGSALPVGRTLAAIIEQYQLPGGGVAVPEVLVPYLGVRTIGPDTPGDTAM